jgi:hypothetical protein
MKCFFALRPLHSEHKLFDVVMPSITFTLSGGWNIHWILENGMLCVMIEDSPSTNISDEIPPACSDYIGLILLLLSFGTAAPIIELDFLDQLLHE